MILYIYDKSLNLIFKKIFFFFILASPPNKSSYLKNDTGLPSIQKRFNPFLKDNDQQFQDNFDAPQEENLPSDDEKLQYDGCNNLTTVTSTNEASIETNNQPLSNLTESLTEVVNNMSINDLNNCNDSNEYQQQNNLLSPEPVPEASTAESGKTIETGLEVNAKNETTIVAERLEKPQPDEHLADWILVGESVLIRPYNASGVIAFVGKTHFQVGG